MPRTLKNKQIKSKNLAVVIFPYLFIHNEEGIDFDGIILKPSYTKVIDNEKRKIKEQVLRIASIFKFGVNKQVNQWSYFTFYINSNDQWKQIEQKLNKFVNLLKFSELKDLKDHAKFDQFNYFLFEITRFNLNQKENYFYNGILNGESSYSFHFRDQIIENPYIPTSSTYPIIFSKDQLSNNSYFHSFYGFSKQLFHGGEEKKILKSIEWFNRSFSHYSRGVDLSEAIINMQTALEALLRPTGEDRSVKAELQTSISNLLGHSVELSRWINSYWKLRNSIVHGDADVESFMYIHELSKRKKGHKHHLHYARKVYVKCLDAILKLRSSFPMVGFEDELLSNEVKLDRALLAIGGKKKISIEKLYKTGVFGTISSLRNDDVSSGREDTKRLGEKLLPLLRENIEDENIRKKIDEILKWGSKDLGDLAVKYSELETSFSPFYFGVSPTKIEVLSLYGAVYNFLGYATWRLLTFYD